MKNKIQERLLKIMKEKDLKQSDLAKMTGIRQSSISDWLKGKYEPKQDKIDILSEALRVSPVYLMGYDTDNTYPPNTLSQRINNLNEKDRKVIINLLDYIEDKNYTCFVKEETVEFYSFPYLDGSASAGKGNYILDNLENISTYLKVPKLDKYKNVSFAISVSGESMLPTIKNGDIALIEKTNFLEVGEIGLFYVDGDLFIKECGDDKLISHNHKYQNIIITEHNEVQTIGRFIGVFDEW